MTTAPGAHPQPRSISVIIPVRNGADTLAEQLAALARQTYTGEWEIVVADNGSTDGTQALAREWAARLPKLSVVDASGRPGASHARNFGASRARGEFLAFCDADDVVVPEWVESLAAAAAQFDVVTGRQDAGALNSETVRSWRSARSLGLPRTGFLPYAPSCNLGVWASVFGRTGGFNEEYTHSEDLEWSWRAQLSSFTLGFAPGAVVHYRYRDSPRGVWRQAYLGGIGSVRLYRDYRSKGQRRSGIGRVLRSWAWIVARLPYLASPARRGIWLRRAGEASGRLVGSARFRVLFL
jgi:glycosyltransferase involved in cell wall biosynthesis